jgi:hypothetical protein
MVLVFPRLRLLNEVSSKETGAVLRLQQHRLSQKLLVIATCVYCTSKTLDMDSIEIKAMELLHILKQLGDLATQAFIVDRFD